MLAMWLARKYTRAALSESGQFFGRRSHTSVLAAQRKVDQLVASQSTIRLDQHACSVEDALRRIEQQLRTG
jgi:chromosomal replication initiator protein